MKSDRRKEIQYRVEPLKAKVERGTEILLQITIRSIGLPYVHLFILAGGGVQAEVLKTPVRLRKLLPSDTLGGIQVEQEITQKSMRGLWGGVGQKKVT